MRYDVKIIEHPLVCCVIKKCINQQTPTSMLCNNKYIEHNEIRHQKVIAASDR